MLEQAQLELIDRAHMVFQLHGFLSEQECEHYITLCEAQGFSTAPITTSNGPMMAPEVRNNERVMIDDVTLAASLWPRVRAQVPERILAWRAHGLNERFRFYRYDVGQRFRPHYDGAFERAVDERSQLSLVIYLNDGFEGGHTVFYTDRRELRFRVQPRRGTALVFLHAQLHEGAAVTRGRKYVMRSDVMYRLTHLA